MKRTVVVRRDYLQYVSKYRRFEKRHKNVSVHCSPCFVNVQEGDVVTIGQCRPLAKTVRFNVLEHQPAVNRVSQSLYFQHWRWCWLTVFRSPWMWRSSFACSRVHFNDLPVKVKKMLRSTFLREVKRSVPGSLETNFFWLNEKNSLSTYIITLELYVVLRLLVFRNGLLVWATSL